MARGGFYIDRTELDRFAVKLKEVAGHTRELDRVYRRIGKHAEAYVIAHEPIYAGSPKDSSSHKPPGYMQSQTKGGGGKRGAYVQIRDVDYLFLHEIGGTSYWHRGGRGTLRKLGGRRHSGDLASVAGRHGAGGHTVYRVPRNPKGRFIWNVAYRLRSYIGLTLCQGIQVISAKRGIAMDITDANLDIPESYLGRGG
jgi:hypothetical protein